ncbi:DUF1715-domain-containing protein [Coprinopsis marcescibilis]|uniref:DUF1715-domain-containing protein n=1 Tax=Coprinopsis marcescibilis TaxID=230819 RepID=A0A5C3KP18_COPMA|nr:DUF1715-domain-containing protein [Coprinopsis marcescibilis]
MSYEDVDLDSLVNLEQIFFDEGYKDGYDHGRIHGLIEGRALGREKGYEMWEELGFYEGFAFTWRAILLKLGKQDERKLHNISSLLKLIGQFPSTNPSQTSSEAEVDIMKLLRQIRSKYKLLCATLGVRPRLQAVDESTAPTEPNDNADEEESNGNPSRIKRSIWNLESASQEAKTPPKPVVTAQHDFSF